MATPYLAPMVFSREPRVWLWPSDFRCYLDSIGKRDECKSRGCTCVQGRYGMGVYICTLDDTDDTDIGNFLALGLKLFVMLALKKETDLS